MALLRAFAAVAMVLGLGVTAPVDAQEAAGPAEAPVKQPAVAQQDAPLAVVTSGGRPPQSAVVAREQVTVGDGGTVTVLRPVNADDEEEDTQGERTRGEDLIGREVVTEENEWVGKVDDVVFDRVRDTVHVVILVGDPRRLRNRDKKKKMTIPLNELERRDERVALLGVSKEKLRRLPELEERTLPSLTRQARIGDRMVLPSRGGRSAWGRKLGGKRHLEARFGALHRLRDVRFGAH